MNVSSSAAVPLLYPKILWKRLLCGLILLGRVDVKRTDKMFSG